MMVQRMQRGQIGMHHDGAWMQRGSAVFVFVSTGANTGEQKPRRFCSPTLVRANTFARTGGGAHSARAARASQSPRTALCSRKAESVIMGNTLSRRKRSPPEARPGGDAPLQEGIIQSSETTTTSGTVFPSGNGTMKGKMRFTLTRMWYWNERLSTFISNNVKPHTPRHLTSSLRTRSSAPED